MPRSSIIRCTSSMSVGHFWISSMQITVSRRSRASISCRMRVGSARTAVYSPWSSSERLSVTVSASCCRT